jgi:Tol biopolymer transport system component
MRSTSKVLIALVVVLATLFCGFGAFRYYERRKLTRSLQALERRSGWRILLYDGQLHLLNLEDHSLRFVNTQPTTTPCGIGTASLSPNGEQIVFSETSCSHFDSLVSVDLVARKRKELLKLPTIRGPRWSPAGDSIAFGGKRDGSSVNSGLFIYKIKDGSLSTVLDDQLKSGDFLLSWSPDGRRIVFQSGSDQITIIDVGTGESRAIDTGSFPTWSPNGSYITYQSDATRHVLYNVETNQKRLILKGESVGGSLVWSPDSRYVVYSKLSGGLFSWVSGALSASDSHGDLYVMDIQSKVEARLYRNPGSLYATDWGKGQSESRPPVSDP